MFTMKAKTVCAQLFVRVPDEATTDSRRELQEPKLINENLEQRRKSQRN